MMVTGSAPISKAVLDFMKVILSCPIIEGYGQTEGTTLNFNTDIVDPEAGHVILFVDNFVI
jgi:long-chain acyl-CoA synthetase